jgi:iron complex transport system ATP-binding protein
MRVHREMTGSGRLECTGLVVRRGPRIVLSNISLGIGGSECVTLVGPNGSGKTTLLLALAGLLEPVDGSIRAGGVDVRRYAAAERARLFAYVPQTLEHTPAFQVRAVVATGRYAHVGHFAALSRADEAAVDHALARCGLGALADRPLDGISGGERQKTLIAAAMAQDAQMLLLDEPTTALDPAYQQELVGILRGWHAAGRGVVLVSHDLQLPAALGGRVIAMRAGQVIADGPAEQILAPETLAAVYGGSRPIALDAQFPAAQ